MTTPCGACKLLRRKCTAECIFAPYFPPHEPWKFTLVHKVFGADNMSKMIQDLPVYERADAVKSLVYDAQCRVQDPVNGCKGKITTLQEEVIQVQTELAAAKAEFARIMQNGARRVDW